MTQMKGSDYMYYINMAPSEDVLESIFEGNPLMMSHLVAEGYVVHDKWYLDPKFNHFAIHDKEGPLGSIYYEILPDAPNTGLFHLAFIPGRTNWKVTKDIGDQVLGILKCFTELEELMGVIPVTNRAACLYAKRMGFKDLGDIDHRPGFRVKVFIFALRENNNITDEDLEC